MDSFDTFVEWLKNTINLIWQSLVGFLDYALYTVVDSVLSAIIYVISILPLPQFMSGGLQDVVSQLPGGILYFLDRAGFPEALAIIGSGYLFRFGRKIVTLFQW
jgi:hypothetical protein